MMSCLPVSMKPPTLFLMLWLLLRVFAPPWASASDSSNPSPNAQAVLAADDFDWREMVPYLFAAAAMPGEQGIKTVLENSRVLRAYVGNEVRADCRADKNRCAVKGDGLTLEGEVTKRIDAIVQEAISRQHKSKIVDYPLARQPFPFSEIVAVKSEKKQDAYLILQLADHHYTAAQVQDKYGAPYDTDIVQWYSIYKYRVDSPSYTSKAVFEINPVDGTVLKVAISLKLKRDRSQQ
jgi:hypothetical protein